MALQAFMVLFSQEIRYNGYEKTLERKEGGNFR